MSVTPELPEPGQSIPLGVVTNIGELFDTLVHLYELHPTALLYSMAEDGTGMHPSIELERLADGRLNVNIRQREV